MQQAPVFLVILLGLSSLLSVYLAGWAYMHQQVPASREYSWLFFCIALYSLGYSIEISQSELQGVLTAIRLEYIGLSFIPSLTFMFILHFIRGKKISNQLSLLFNVIPVITLILVFTVEKHNFFYINPHLIQGEFFLVLDFERGFWYYIHFINILALTISGLIMLIWFSFRSKGRLRQQAMIMAFGSFLPILSGIVYFLGWIPGKIDPTPFSLVISGLIFSVLLFKLELFELVPAAREFALDSIQDGFLLVDGKGIVLDCNQATHNLFHTKPIHLGDNLLKHPVLGNHLHPLLEKNLNQVEFFIQLPGGDSHFYEATAHPIKSPLFSSKGISILIRDVSEKVILLEKLRNQANLDGLTELFNRRCLMELGTHALKTNFQDNQCLGIVIMDLDHFKLVNDQYGHAAGDLVLREVATRITHSLRDMDILGRYGGEEFALILPGSNRTSMLHVAERIRLLVESSAFVYEGIDIRITASFGVYLEKVTQMTNLDDLFKKADAALYAAKHEGRNRVCIFQDSHLP